MRVLAYPPDHRRRDLDNLAKAILDALQHAGVYGNDCQVKLLTLAMMDTDTINPRAEITIGALELSE
jgi:crossover junction endodeoxyribonuclease RusA